MPFSFTPAQVAATGMAVQGGALPVQGEAAPVSNSPIIFLRERGKEKSVNAYLQLLLLLVSILFIAASLVLFGYSKYLTTSIESNKSELLAKDATFKSYPFDTMKRLSGRIAALHGLLDGYVSVRSPLRLLEDVVEKQVVFNEFQLTGKNGTYGITFNVVTGNYRSLIQQLESLNLTQYKKIAPSQKLGSPKDSASTIEVRVTTPVFVQGMLSDDIVFLPDSPAPISQGESSVATSTIPQ